MKTVLGGLVFLIFIQICMAQTDFVQVNNNHFQLEGKTYHIVGINFWYGMNLGSQGEGGDRDRLLRELDRLQALGINNLRIMGASEGPDDAPWRMVPSLQPRPGEYNLEVWDGLDFLLAEMGKREMKAVVCLNNFWPWSGGMAQYQHWFGGKDIPYPPPAPGGDWARYQLYTSGFYQNKEAINAFEAHVERLLLRYNPYSQLVYKDDPTIMAWEIANEARGILKKKAYRRFLLQTARLIKSLDVKHLVTTGSEGKTPSPWAGNRFEKDHLSEFIDYTTAHIWVQNWGWYDPEKADKSLDEALIKAKKYLSEHVAMAEKLGKPLVLEEFGISRDRDSHHPQSGTGYRDRFYEEMFEEVANYIRQGSALAGSNFWAWGGEGRPRVPKAVWKPGDDFIGDPPHEYQGWYSVYERDSSTLKVIQRHVEVIRGME